MGSQLLDFWGTVERQEAEREKGLTINRLCFLLRTSAGTEGSARRHIRLQTFKGWGGRLENEEIIADVGATSTVEVWGQLDLNYLSDQCHQARLSSLPLMF